MLPAFDCELNTSLCDQQIIEFWFCFHVLTRAELSFATGVASFSSANIKRIRRCNQSVLIRHSKHQGSTAAVKWCYRSSSRTKRSLKRLHTWVPTHSTQAPPSSSRNFLRKTDTRPVSHQRFCLIPRPNLRVQRRVDSLAVLFISRPIVLIMLFLQPIW